MTLATNYHSLTDTSHLPSVGTSALGLFSWFHRIQQQTRPLFANETRADLQVDDALLVCAPAQRGEPLKERNAEVTT